jgi:hypothetical protein
VPVTLTLIVLTIALVLDTARRRPEQLAWMKAYWLSAGAAIVLFAVVACLLAVFGT